MGWGLGVGEEGMGDCGEGVVGWDGRWWGEWGDGVRCGNSERME